MILCSDILTQIKLNNNIPFLIFGDLIIDYNISIKRYNPKVKNFEFPNSNISFVIKVSNNNILFYNDFTCIDIIFNDLSVDMKVFFYNGVHTYYVLYFRL